jgi:hypothetical protein
MDIQSLVRSMRARMPWPVGQRVLRENNLPRGRGWDNTLEHFRDRDADYSKKLDALEAALKEHFLCGEKLVQFYEVSKSVSRDLVERLRSTRIPNSPFKAAYPSVLPEAELERVPSTPTLVAVETTDDGVAAVFASARSVELREPVPHSARLADALLSKYDEIIGVKHVRQQAMDVVSVSAKNPHVSIRVDYPHGLHRDVGEAAQCVVKTEFAKIVKNDQLPVLPINLFPLINKMYKQRGEGVVVELAFGTTTASLKHEKMRRRVSCLREETYHKGGKAALRTPIEPYRLSIIWLRPLKDGFSRPELGLYSTAAMVGSPIPVLREAVIRKCMGISDFDHVTSRMSHFLSQPN